MDLFWRLLNIGFIVSAIFHIIWATIVVIFHKKYLDRFQYLGQDNIRLNKDFEAFARDDFLRWNRTQMLLTAILVFPFRFIGTLIIIVSGAAIIKFLKIYMGVKSYEDDNPRFNRLASSVSKNFAGLIIFLVGVRVKVTRLVLDQSEFKNIKINSDVQKAPILISNHVTWIDIMFFMSTTSPGFVSKAGVKNVPLISTYAQFLQSIFVERGDESNRGSALIEIESRAKRILEGENLNSIHVFPEGTTTNGDYVLNFKKGAFSTPAPLKVFGLKYKGMINVAMTSISSLDNIILCLLQPITELEWIQVNGVIENKYGLTPDEFAEEVRQIYIKKMGFKPSDNSFRDKKEFEKLIDQTIKCIGRPKI